MKKYAKKAFKKTKRTFKRSAKKSTTKVVKAIQEQGGITVMNKTVKTMNFSRTNIGYLTITNPITTSTVQGVIITRFNEIPLYTEFTALFDKYRFNYIKYNWRMINTPATGDEWPTMFTYKMNDPDLTIPTEAITEQQAHMKRMVFSDDNRTFSTKIYPYWLGINYASSAVVGYDYNSARKSSYLDTHYPNIAHYGLCYFIPSTPGGLTTNWSIICDIEYNFSLKCMA